MGDGEAEDARSRGAVLSSAGWLLSERRRRPRRSCPLASLFVGDGAVGEKGEKVALRGDDMGEMMEDKGVGRCGGGVGDRARGVACPDEVGDRTGDDSRGE